MTAPTWHEVMQQVWALQGDEPALLVEREAHGAQRYYVTIPSNSIALWPFPRENLYGATALEVAKKALALLATPCPDSPRRSSRR